MGSLPFVAFTIWKMKHLLNLSFDFHTVKSIWTQLDNCFPDDFRLLTLTPQTFLFEILNDSSIAEIVY